MICACRTTLQRLTVAAMLLAYAGVAQAQVLAQQAPAQAQSPVSPSKPAGQLAKGLIGLEAAPGKLPVVPPSATIHKGELYLSAMLTQRDAQPLAKGPVQWRVFDDVTDAQGRHRVVAQSTDAAPTLSLPEGTYIVHVAVDLASAVRRVTVGRQASSERLILNAGALRIVGMLGDKPVNPSRLSISIYVPEAGNSEAKLVLTGAKAGDLIALPEGNYHVVSTLLDMAGYAGAQKSGVGNKTNSVVAADLKVQGGKLTDATLRHRSAVMTLKLVNETGGEALANTAFTILTPGGDVIRELIGAFPSLVLAEGEYVAIARHDNRTFQTTFQVSSTLDRDVEILAK